MAIRRAVHELTCRCALDPKRRLITFLSIGIALIATPCLVFGQRPASTETAQSTNTALPKPIITRQPLFSIPFFINPNSQDRPKKVHLFVSGDRGENWTRYQTRSAAQNRFDFQAGEDGEFWFVVRTVANPTNLGNGTNPEKVVKVDRSAPEIELNISAISPRELTAEWDARDDNLQAGSFRLEYRAVGAPNWLPVDLQPVHVDSSGKRYVGKVSWEVAPSVEAFEIRAEVLDRAGNRQEELREHQTETVTATDRETRYSSNPQPSRLDPINDPPLGLAPLPERRNTIGETRTIGSDDLAASHEPRRQEDSRLNDLPALTDPPGLGATANGSQLAPIEDRPRLQPRRRRLPWQNDDTANETQETTQLDPSAMPRPSTSQVTASPEIPANTSNNRYSDLDPLPAPLGTVPNDVDSRQEESTFSANPRNEERPLDDYDVHRPRSRHATNDRSAPDLAPLDPLAPSRYQPPVAGTDADARERLDRRPSPTPAPQPSSDLTPMTSSRVFDLDYDVTDLGNSPVGRVELWYTVDDGETWRPHGTDPDLTSPYRVEFDREGRYGFRLLVHNEIGNASRPPQPGEAPDLTVGIDWTKPRVQVETAVFTTANANAVEIKWTAEEEHLGKAPVRIAFAPTPDGPWYPVTDGMENTGEYVWEPKHPLPRKVYIRVRVEDRAGNVGEDQLTSPVGFGELAPRGVIRRFRPK